MNTDTSQAPALRRASRIASIAVSEILRIGARAAQLKREGRDVIVLGAGEPDFDTPDNVKQAAVRAIEEGQTKYTLLDGTLALKAAIARKFERENGLSYAPDEITVGAGAKQVIHNALMATLDEGDEVVVGVPYWTSYADMIAIAGGKTIEVPCSEENGFRMAAADLERAITGRTRWVMLNSPSNPTGAAYSEAHLRELAQVLLRHPHVWLMCDDIYEHLIYGDFAFRTMAQVEPRLKARTLTINGLSKAYAMTGWRIGYAGGPKPLIGAMAVVQSQSTSNPCSISQAAAIEALDGPQDILAERRRSFQARRDLVVDGLNAIAGLSCRRPEGAFYTYASCAGVMGRRTPGGQVLHTDIDFCQYLLQDHDVAVVPGTVFGLAPYFRISYATSQAQLQTALERIGRAVAQLV
ncbi:aspartate aminotransferase [Bordetella genomosp. 7]|uniref:Aminotransferase n=1 Tax=Bordetella genomosp. 7 TaxID=1416805 RepID=A0A261QZH6_9BORD|nr:MULTISPECIES: pyridoxal phosphate-dependent aminotransferase [Bordetella]OZI18174.1 aspartate aminotransferase [Bordetella genomosp. 7]OZI21969.1 aspartate aminotransferase [Bordetella genomosp. 7]